MTDKIQFPAHPVDALVKLSKDGFIPPLDPKVEQQLRAICDEEVPYPSSAPSNAELISCICGLVIQHGLIRPTTKRDFFGRIEKQGERFEPQGNSADEEAEAILTQLGLIDCDGFVVGDLPLSALEAARRTARPASLWTREKPTASGWYWLRHNSGRDQVVEIYRYSDGGVEQLYVRWDESHKRGRDLLVAFDPACLWAGPIGLPG